MNSKLRWVLVAALILIAGVAAGMVIGRGSAKQTPAVVPTQEDIAPAAPSDNARVVLARGDTAQANGSYQQAQKLYAQALDKSPDSATSAKAQKQLGEANIQAIFSTQFSPSDLSYEVQSGDTLTKIAKKYHVTVELLRVCNGLRGDLVRLGQMLKIPNVNFIVFIDKSQNLLTLKNGEQVFKTYRCSTGRGGITPVGDFKIVHKLIDPVWKGIVAPGDPKNPLGTRWLGFDLPQYGIHGTNDPSTIGQPVTHGCVRMLNEDVEELYTLLPVGTVIIIAE